MGQGGGEGATPAHLSTPDLPTLYTHIPPNHTPCPTPPTPTHTLPSLHYSFMGIAEQMGRVLQRTSISVNIKERLDFSCALFGPDGSLVGARGFWRPPCADEVEGERGGPRDILTPCRVSPC